MSVVAILGAGPVGAAVAQRLAERGGVREIRLIDSNANIAAGKALDIQQAGPIGGYDTTLSAASDLLAAAGTSVIVLADDTVSGEWQGERGLGVLRQLTRAGTPSPFVFAGARQIWLMEAAARELKVPTDRLIGTAASGVASAVAALAAIDIGRTGTNVAVTGRPPALVIGWASATIAGSLVTDLVPAHRLRAISRALPRLWPPGPQAIGAATAPVVEALIHGSRRLHQATTIAAGELGARGLAVTLPLELGHGRVLARTVPSLSSQERTEVVNGLQSPAGGE